MDNHPIPQDVTGFQFKLFGNMTIKQFAYLATGGVTAWVLLQLPIAFLIKFPLAFFFAILGAGLAYVPISGRPMDIMIINFIKDIFMPTQFVYGKTGEDGYGLAHISEYHSEILPYLEKIIREGEVFKQSTDRVLILNKVPIGKGVAVLRLDWNGASKQWLVTAF